jgi:glycerophosphoryl diester phosphodiesterase
VIRRALALALLALGLTVLVAGAVATSAQPLVFAHRGDVNPRDGYPENTLQAISQAVERGADGVEFDVQVSLDGTCWLLHDGSVDRTTDGTGSLSRMHDAQIEALKIDGGLGWRDGMAPGHLTRLTDALAAAGPTIRLEVDLKFPDAAAARRTAEALRGLGARISVNVKSHEQIAIIREALPGVTIVAQPDWIKDALTAPDVDVVLVWGKQLDAALKVRPPNRVELFRNPVTEIQGPDETQIAQRAAALGLRAFLTTDLASVLPSR